MSCNGLDTIYSIATVVIDGVGSAGSTVEAALTCSKYGILKAHRLRVTSGAGTATYVINQRQGEGDIANDYGIITPVLTGESMHQPIIHDQGIPFKLVGGENLMYFAFDNDGGVGEAGTVEVEIWYQIAKVSPGLADN